MYKKVIIAEVVTLINHPNSQYSSHRMQDISAPKNLK